MDQAGAGVARAVTKFFPNPGACIVFVGKGHNAGDALFAAECLRRRGWKIEVRLAFKENDCSELMRKKLDALRATAPKVPAWMDQVDHDVGVTILELFAYAADSVAGKQDAIAAEAYPGTISPIIILDGLLGLGAKPPLRGPVRAACREINGLRRQRNVYVFAVDLPTGLDGDSGKTDRDGVVADFTVTIGFAKPGLVADGALDFVGRLEVVSLDELRPPEKKAKEIVACAPALRGLLPRRKFSTYKNQCGRIGVIAGSKGFIGAALMTSQGALRAGAGLVEVFVPEEIYPIVAAAAPQEATATKFCNRFAVTLLFKGSRTIVARRDRPLSYNTTGNPGMASGGMGDILTGVCAGLAGQGLSLYDAARLGAWICGRAAEIA